MEAWVVLTGIVVCSLAFIMWLGMFALSRGMNSNLETDAESRRIANRQLFFGALLLACTIGLSAFFYQMDRPEMLPEIGPGLTTEAPMVKEAIEAKTEAKEHVPVAIPPAPTPPAKPAAPEVPKEPDSGVAEGAKPLPNPEVI
jgi:hypothetical protein